MQAVVRRRIDSASNAHGPIDRTVSAAAVSGIASGCTVWGAARSGVSGPAAGMAGICAGMPPTGLSILIGGSAGREAQSETFIAAGVGPWPSTFF